jgi:5-methylthioadenosine/S-adenosylhomocysteine deaminase
MQVHVCETRAETDGCLTRYGRTPVAMLAAAGVFDGPAIAAHCVCVTEDDMDILRAKGVTVAHNPVSNLKLASGVAPVARMLEKGVNVALGTDGVCSNNSHDLFEEIKLAAILQKGITGNPTAVPALAALNMATVNGAAAQGRSGSIGKLAVGMDASLILLDMTTPQMTPTGNPVSAAVYAAKGSDVCLTMVRGRVLYENGVYYTVDMERVRHALKTAVMPRVFGA